MVISLRGQICCLDACSAAGIKKTTVHSIPEDASRPLVAVGSAICKTCKELDAAALVTMSGHKGPLEELVMGSVTSYLAHHCESPVLVLS
jgi:nucleotide-binding universal stress UspA family protein